MQRSAGTASAMLRGSRGSALRRIAAALLALGSLVVPSPSPAQAKVDFDVKDGKFVITAPIDLIGGEDHIAKNWEDAIRKYWNNGPGLGRFKYCGMPVEFVPSIKPIAAGQQGRPDAAKIRMQLVPEGRPFISNVRGLDPARNSTGTWGSNEDDATIAHEFGHILGLRDEYVWVPYTDTDSNGRWDAGEPMNDDRNHNGKRDPGEPTHPTPGNEGSLMAEASGTVMQRHIDAALSAVRGLKCWKGAANINSSAVYPEGSVTCQDGWELEFTFVARAEGTIGGQGTAEQTSGPTCPFPIGPSWKDVKYQVLGGQTADGFSLRFALVSWEPADGAEYAGFASIFGLPALPSGGPPVAVAVSGTSGTGQGMWQFESGNPPATYSANGAITIECVTCEDAVG
ncbi:MAG: hypothetical protein ACXWWX_06420 [Actinomycetota bacterium]